MGKIIDCHLIADRIRASVKTQLSGLKKAPKLVALSLSDNEASNVYLRNQIKCAENLGIQYELRKISCSWGLDRILHEVGQLNRDRSVNGIIIEMPLPKNIDGRKVYGAVDPLKDAEGMHPENLGKVLLGEGRISPCTPAAVMEILESTGVDMYGKVAVCVGHSNIVGKPLSMLLLNRFATTTVCHIATSERGMLKKYVKEAEILIVAVGKPSVVKSGWIKKGAVVIDVGINRLDNKIVGDVQFEGALKRAAYITPVPGGVGPLTTIMLMRNVVKLYKLQHATAKIRKI